ncbi:coiled-coil domain-containing protein 115-like [Venturia canescens]|uniref:coiled-coil domain-containing protein 115-like n=1 Tax=Venturia canescens TaxID=32260 RepID=UPI001C9C0B83|nr:coiled-coil domain-containing protein 115-like [Venturia canescens]
MEKTIEDVCEELDKLSLRSLELMEKRVSVNIELEKLIREGHIELAKARYIRGKESIGILQVPQDGQVDSLFELERNLIERRGKDLPNFDISLKASKTNGEKSYDPIKWFGVLVPQNLKSAQKRFQESLYFVVEAANINSELDSIPNELEALRTLKKNLTK